MPDFASSHWSYMRWPAHNPTFSFKIWIFGGHERRNGQVGSDRCEQEFVSAIDDIIQESRLREHHAGLRQQLAASRHVGQMHVHARGPLQDNVPREQVGLMD